MGTKRGCSYTGGLILYISHLNSTSHYLGEPFYFRQISGHCLRRPRYRQPSLDGIFSVRAVNSSALNILQKRNTAAGCSASEKIKKNSIIIEETTQRQKYELRGQLTFFHSHEHKPRLLVQCQGCHVVRTAKYLRRQSARFWSRPKYVYVSVLSKLRTHYHGAEGVREYASGEQTVRCTKSIRNGKICPSRLASPNLINGFPWICWWECYFLSNSLILARIFRNTL